EDFMGEKRLNDIQRLSGIDKFIEAIKASPDILKKGLSGEEFAKEIINGAKALAEYIHEED
ncbi:MAG: hypothetical protein FWB99_08850, partial [Treponema sp.]|nr:hypothetical protein [Treponema sp.]